MGPKRCDPMSETGHSLHTVCRPALSDVRFDLKTDLIPPDPMAVCTENFIRVDVASESPKLAE